MRTGLTWIQAVMSALGGFLGWYLGGVDGFIYTLVVFVSVDLITGIMCAVQAGQLSSSICMRGISKKIVIFALVGVGHMLDMNVIHHDSVVRTAVIFFYLASEGISLMENAAHLGLPIPGGLRKALMGLHGDGDEVREKDRQWWKSGKPDGGVIKTEGDIVLKAEGDIVIKTDAETDGGKPDNGDDKS